MQWPSFVVIVGDAVTRALSFSGHSLRRRQPALAARARASLASLALEASSGISPTGGIDLESPVPSSGSASLAAENTPQVETSGS